LQLLNTIFNSLIKGNVLAEALKVDARIPLNTVSLPHSNVSEDEQKLNCRLVTNGSSLLQFKGTAIDHLRCDTIEIQTNYH